jgi:Holliday junction resolvase RusA-like endonuclease
LLTEDFAVSVKNLPKFKDYQSLKQLKALLWDHLDTKIFTDDHQIVNIHFARADVKKLKILIAIKNLKT